MKNESQRIQVDPRNIHYMKRQADPRNIHYMKRNVLPGPYKQCATPQEEDVKLLGVHLDRRLT
jgi:hypothetical protein